MTVPAVVPAPERRAGPMDLYSRYMDAPMRRIGGNGSQFLFEVAGAVDVEALRGRLAELAIEEPLLRMGLRGWPRSRWVETDGGPTVSTEPSNERAEQFFDRWFAQPFRPPHEPSLEFVLGTHPERTLVLVRWHHVLADAQGMDLLLQAIERPPSRGFRWADSPPSLFRRVVGAGWRARLGLFVRLHLYALRHAWAGLVPDVRRAPPARGPQRGEATVFDAVETATIDERGRPHGRALERNPQLLAVAAMAAAQALGARPWERIVLPVPINLRPGGGARGPALSNYLSVVLVSARAAQLTQIGTAVRTLRGAFEAALARREDACGVVVLGVARFLPPALMRLLVQGPSGKEPSSIWYTSVELGTGRSGSFLGRPLRTAIVASSIYPAPGLGVVFFRFREQLGFTIVHRGSPLAAELGQRVRALLLGEESRA